MQEPELVELEVRGIWGGEPPLRPPGVLVRPRAWLDGPLLCLSLPSGEVHVLGHEARGEATVRSQALDFAVRTLGVLGAYPAAVHLRQAEFGLVAASARIQTRSGQVEVPIAPGLALALHAWLHLPLYAPSALFCGAQPAVETPLAPAIARLLDALERGEPYADTPADS